MFDDYIRATQKYYNTVNQNLTLDDLLNGHSDSLIGSRVVWDETNQQSRLKGRVLQYLFHDVWDKDYSALDFGCAVGRHIQLMNDKFASIDGCDISSFLLSHARSNMERNGIDNNLYLTNDSLGEIPEEHYDCVYTLYVFQHIVVRGLRNNYLRQLFDKLKPGGIFRGQFGLIGAVERSGMVNYFNEECPQWASEEYGFVQNDSEKNWVDDLHNVGFVGVESTVVHYKIQEPWRYCQNDLLIRAQKL